MLVHGTIDDYPLDRHVKSPGKTRASVNCYAIFDDYQNLPDCRRAIDEFRLEHGIAEQIHAIDERAVFWRKHD